MPDAIWQFYGASVRMHRIKKGWKQQQLAVALKLQSKASISQIESGEAIPSGDKMVDMANLFAVTVGSMLGEPQMTQLPMDPVLIQGMGALLQLVPDGDARRRVVAQMLTALAKAIERETAPRPESLAPPALDQEPAC